MWTCRLSLRHAKSSPSSSESILTLAGGVGFRRDQPAELVLRRDYLGQQPVGFNALRPGFPGGRGGGEHQRGESNGGDGGRSAVSVGWSFHGFNGCCVRNSP